MDGSEPIAEYERVKRIVGEFCATRTKADLLELACTSQLLIAPVASPSDVLSSTQFAARDYFDQVDDDALSSGQPVTAPGPWVWSSTQPPVRLGRTLRLGEHTDTAFAQQRSAARESLREREVHGGRRSRSTGSTCST